MSAALLPALRRSLTLFAMAFAVAAVAFGMTMLTAPPISKAAVAEAGAIPPVTNCEFLPFGDANGCTVYR